MSGHPLVLSTWSFGPVANAAAVAEFARGGSALDAAVAGATAVEDDVSVDSVGVGGLPDASGRVSLDACVMTDPDRCGGVCAVRGYANVARIARRVMERTIHVLLAGEGAEAFAAREGFARHARDLLTPEAKAAWEKWKRDHPGVKPGEREGVLPPMNVEERYARARGGASGGPPRNARGEPSHDTVCVLTRDGAGQVAGVCTTSGLGFKVPGRVGDSPIIGHGLYVDSRVGGASATGNGELIMGVCGSFLAVELMRQGRTPTEAVVGVLERVAASYDVRPEHQAALIVMRRDGAWASGSLRPGFSHCISDERGTRLEAGQAVLVRA